MAYNEKELQAKLQKEKENTINFPSKKETIGDILKNKRLETGKSITEISDYLRIKTQYLEALEENKFNNLPGSAYVIGFIKSYAYFLKLDVNSIIIQYKQESGALQSYDSNDTEDENTVIKDPIINSNHIILASIIVVFGIIFISFTGAKTPISPSTNENYEKNIEVSIDNSNISPVQEDKAEADEITLNPVSNSKALLPPVEYFETKLENIQDSAPVVVATPSLEQQPPVVEENEKEVVVNEPYIAKEYGLENKENTNIYIMATKKVWIKLKKDGLYKYDVENGDIGTGKTVFETILEAGDTYYIPNGENYYLTIGNAQGVNIYVDGTLVPPFSKKEVSRHNIEMNIEKLKNGTAYIRNRVIE